MPKKRKAAKKTVKRRAKKSSKVKKSPRTVKQKQYTHATHPGVPRDHHTLFIFWVISALLLIVVVALLRAAS